MSIVNMADGFVIIFEILNFLFPEVGFRSRWLTSKTIEAGTGLMHVTGGFLLAINIILLLV